MLWHGCLQLAQGAPTLPWLASSGLVMSHDTLLRLFELYSLGLSQPHCIGPAASCLQLPLKGAASSP